MLLASEVDKLRFRAEIDDFPAEGGYKDWEPWCKTVYEILLTTQKFYLYETFEDKVADGALSYDQGNWVVDVWTDYEHFRIEYRKKSMRKEAIK